MNLIKMKDLLPGDFYYDPDNMCWSLCVHIQVDAFNVVVHDFCENELVKYDWMPNVEVKLLSRIK